MRIDVCICGGAWFDLGEVQRFTGQAVPARPMPAVAAAPPTLVRGDCPRCPGQALQPRQFAARTVAGCAICRGVWLSRAALHELVPAERPATDSSDGDWWAVAIEAVLHALPWC